jgi:hypothetical protein
MGYSYFPLDSLPQQYDVVWCLYPEYRLTPGPIARPGLVLDVRINKEQQVGALIVTYGTGEFEARHFREDLIILANEYEALGLHKNTRFALSLNSRKCLPWCAEYFVPPSYAKSQNIVAGSLNEYQIKRLRVCLAARGLQPY